MKLSMPTEYISDKLGFDKTFEVVSDAGFDAMDFTFYAHKEFYSNDTKPEFFAELKRKANANGLVFNQGHAPFPSSVMDETRTKEIFDDIVCSIKNASLLGIRAIVVHPYFHLDYTDNKDKLFELNMEFYKKLIPYSEEYGVKIALENMWGLYKPGIPHHSVCSTPEEFIRYFDELNNSCFTCCLDLGHAMLVKEDAAEFIRKLGSDRLTCLHVQDINGTNDSHNLPYFGIIRWDDVAKALGDINYKGDFTFETDNFVSPLPAELMPSCTKLLADTGRYIISKIIT